MQTTNISHEQEFFDVIFDGVHEFNLMNEIITRELKLFERGCLINLVETEKERFKIRSENYFVMKEFLSKINFSSEKERFFKLYKSGFLLCTTLSPNLDYFDCFNREIDAEFIQTLADLKLTFAYTIQL